MAQLSDAIENVFSEVRMLVLGGQVLLGFSYRICFEKKFEHISRPAQLAEIAGLAIMTAALGWLIWPAAFHQIAVKGRMTAGLHAFTSKVLDWALLPIALGLALTQYTVASALDLRFAPAIGAGAGAFALGIWYAWSLAGRPGESKRKVHQQLLQQEQKQRDEPDLSDRIKKVLLECRMALPGAQAFLGFQFAIVFVQGFEQLPRTWQLIHFASLLATTIATVLLIAPAAYHRIHKAGDNTERFHRVASRLMLAALVFLWSRHGGRSVFSHCQCNPPADPRKLGGRRALAGAFYGLWFGVSSWRRK